MHRIGLLEAFWKLSHELYPTPAPCLYQSFDAVQPVDPSPVVSIVLPSSCTGQSTKQILMVKVGRSHGSQNSRLPQQQQSSNRNVSVCASRSNIHVISDTNCDRVERIKVREHRARYSLRVQEWSDLCTSCSLFGQSNEVRGFGKPSHKCLVSQIEQQVQRSSSWLLPLWDAFRF